MRNILVAYDAERAIGNENELLWKPKEMKTDMARFRELTNEKTLILGRKTLESIGKALPNRRNIVITTQETLDIQNVEIAHSPEEAFNIAGNDEVFVIGGSQIYALSLPSVDRIYATEVSETIQPADSYFPAINLSIWRETNREAHEKDDNNIYNFDFVTYERI